MKALIIASVSLILVSAFASEQYNYSGEVEFQIRGLEYRNFNNYPADRKRPGYRANAKADAQKICTDLKTELESNNLISDFTCDGVRDVEARRNRSTYQANVSFKVDAEAVLKKTYPNVEGLVIKASDYPNARPNKWQVSRQAARDSYFKACELFETEMIRQHDKKFIVVDCGFLEDDGGGDGWHFFSAPTVYVMPNPADIPLCSNGKREDEVWWDVEDSAIVKRISCEFGGNRTDTYDRHVERICDDQAVTNSGRFRRGDFRGSSGSCFAPANCGSRTHDETWVEIDHSNPIRVDQGCEFGGSSYDSYERTEHYSCYNGSTRLDRTSRGSFIGTQGSCQAPASCGRHGHGSSWAEQTGRVRVAQRCPWGGNRVDVYEEITRYSCYDGSRRHNGTRRGSFIRSRGRCNDRPPRMMPPRMMPPRMMPPRMMPPRMMPPRMMPPRMMPPRMMPPRMMPPRMMPPRMRPPRMMPPRMMPPRMRPPRMMPPRMMPPRMMPPRMRPPRMMPPRMMPPRMMRR